MTRTADATVDDFVLSQADPERALRVVIADDHPFYRASLGRLLERNNFEVVAEVANGDAAVRAVQELEPDVAVVDLNMAGSSGLAATQEITELVPDVPVMVLSVSADERDVTDAILAGASGYMLKDRPHAEIVSGIRAAAAGQAPLSPRIAAMLIRRLRDSGDLTEEEIRRRVSLYALGTSAENSSQRPRRQPAPRLPRRW
jgi:DNA-binding NarL/FixJ family response regulator